MGLDLSAQDVFARAGIHRTGLRADDAHLFGHRAFIDDLDQDRDVAVLLNVGFGLTAIHLDARFGIQGYDQQHMRVE